MFKSYVKIAVRNLYKNKLFSLTTILGLGLGMACSLLIFLWVQDEKNMDAFHKKGDRLYNVYETIYSNGAISAGYGTRGPLPEEMKRMIPEIEGVSGFAWQETHTFSVGDKVGKMDGNSAGADFFSMFSYPLIEGRASDALNDPESIAISRNLAVRFFGSPSAAIGKTIRYENKRDFAVKAVFEDLSHQVSERFDFLLNWEAFKQEHPWARGWGATGPHALLLLRPETDRAAVEKKIRHFLDSYTQHDKGFHVELGLQPFSDKYLHSRFANGLPAGGRIEYVRLFSLVAFFILVIACINFMNLTTAVSVKRAREIGIRKVMGALRTSLIRQFIGEALLMALLSSILALLLVGTVLPAFNGLTGKQIVLPYADWTFWCYLSGGILLTGLFSGSYPAFFLSGFNPIRVLKGARANREGGDTWFRKGLVVFQFVLSIILIISTLLISRQVNYIQTTSLGYDRQDLLYIPIEGDLYSKLDLFMSEVLRSPAIRSVSPISQAPTEVDNGEGAISWEGKDPGSRPMFTQLAVGYDFTSTMKIPMVEGRDYSRSFATDSVGYILNEAALKIVGYKDPIGKSFTFWDRPGKIIGIVRDFHFQSLHETIRPLVLRLGIGQNNFWVLLVRTRPGKTKDALATLEHLCKELNPRFPFTVEFSDDQYGRLYRSEQIIGNLSMIFAGLAIFISCLGLLGLSMFTAEQRTREIGIRKVLGASTASLFHLLSIDFLVLVGIAFALAAPLAGWGMKEWLRQFAYQTDIPWWIFGLSGMMAILVALVTISLQAIRAATASPVKSLKAE